MKLMNSDDKYTDLPEVPVNLVSRLERLNPADFHRTTYVERQHERARQEELLNGEITIEEADQQRAESKEYSRNSALRIAREQGLANDPEQLEVIQAMVDQEHAELQHDDETKSTNKAYLVFDQLGPLAHPGLEWDELDDDQQDLYRRAGENVIIDHYENDIASDYDFPDET